MIEEVKDTIVALEVLGIPKRITDLEKTPRVLNQTIKKGSDFSQSAADALYLKLANAAPQTIGTTTLVTNLNSDLCDGFHLDAVVQTIIGNINQPVKTSSSPTFVGLTLSAMTTAGFVKNNVTTGLLTGGNAIALADISGLLSGTSPIVFTAGTGVISWNFAIANTWTGTQTIDLVTVTDKGLVIQGAASQTGNLLEFQKSDATVLGFFKQGSATGTAGLFVVGSSITGTPPVGSVLWAKNSYNANSTINIVAQINGTNAAWSVAQSGEMHALHIQATVYGRLGNAQTGASWGAYYQVISQTGADYTGTVTTMGSFVALNEHYAPGTITNQKGMWSYNIVKPAGANPTTDPAGGNVTTSTALLGYVDNQSTSTITTAKALDLYVTNIGGGAITTGYGAYINSIAGTTAYGIYDVGNNWFLGVAGRLQFRATTQYIGSSAANVLDIVAPTINLTASTAVQFGTYAAGVIVQAGYITINDAGGTPRRLLIG
jgi:hypothetical protein